jgi:hypothetical protein
MRSACVEQGRFQAPYKPPESVALRRPEARKRGGSCAMTALPTRRDEDWRYADLPRCCSRR